MVDEFRLFLLVWEDPVDLHDGRRRLDVILVPQVHEDALLVPIGGSLFCIIVEDRPCFVLVVETRQFIKIFLSMNRKMPS